MADLELKMNAAGVDPNLIAWLQAAAQQSPYRVVAYSGMRKGDPRFHGKGKAIDINLIDPNTGKTIPNYQSPEGFAAYQQFANTARAAQMQMNPEMAKAFRWGGYFGGGKGKYGALDLMHFDVGGVPTAGGSWETGLNPEQAALWKLTPGGGYAGGAGAGAVTASPLADTMAGAAIPPEEIEKQRLYSGLASGLASGSDRTQAQSPEITGDPTGAPQPIGLEVQPASFAPQALPRLSPVETPALADLFQVKGIGGADQRSPYLPPKRKWV